MFIKKAAFPQGIGRRWAPSLGYHAALLGLVLYGLAKGACPHINYQHGTMAGSVQWSHGIREVSGVPEVQGPPPAFFAVERDLPHAHRFQPLLEAATELAQRRPRLPDEGRLKAGDVSVPRLAPPLPVHCSCGECDARDTKKNGAGDNSQRVFFLMSCLPSFCDVFWQRIKAYSPAGA